MSRNKKTEIIIARLLTAVFLFVIISPLSVYASGESASDNDTDEEYGSWSEAFEDENYTDNLAQMVAKYWVSTYLNYVGTAQDVQEDVAEMIGNQYDNTISLYDNLYNYVLPISRQTVNNIDGSNISDSIYGKPIVGKNNLKLIQDTSKTVSNNVDSTLTTIATNKSKNGDVITPDVFPSWFHIATKYPANNLPVYPSDWNSQDLPCVLYYNPQARQGYIVYDLWYPVPNTYTYNLCYIKNTSSTYYAAYGCSYYNSQGYQVNSHRYYLYRYSDYSWSKNLNWITYEDGASSNYYQGDVYYWGSGYITFQNSSQTRAYYWDNDTRTLYFLGAGSAKSYFGTTESNDVIGNYTFSVINSVNLDGFTDLIDQLILDVNMSNTISNSLLLELLQEMRNQRDNYVENDGDDIYDYIDYIMEKLIEVKDVHIEIPDITPDLGGIADALTALLNFLASIIRTIGSIVETLLDGIFHLFVPTDDQWIELNMDFENFTAPFSWIREFVVQCASAISICLFGSDVTDFESSENEVISEDPNLLRLGSGSGGLNEEIIFDANGAPKIPVHFSNSSSEYFSNIEDAYIIDMSWYTPFKPVGDVVVIAFCWLMFVWRVLHDLPGIINGTSGIVDSNPTSVEGAYEKSAGRSFLRGGRR